MSLRRAVTEPVTLSPASHDGVSALIVSLSLGSEVLDSAGLFRALNLWLAVLGGAAIAVVIQAVAWATSKVMGRFGNRHDPKDPTGRMAGAVVAFVLSLVVQFVAGGDLDLGPPLVAAVAAYGAESLLTAAAERHRIPSTAPTLPAWIARLWA